MVDWGEVERLRAKGWSWSRIATDPRSGFHPDADVQDPGSALKTLYRQRRSRERRLPVESPRTPSRPPSSPRWTLARVGMLLTPWFGIWFALAFLLPSPVGAYLPAIPLLGILLAIGGFLLAVGLLKSIRKWTATLRNTAIAGTVLGLVFAGGFGVAALLAGCPTLTPGVGPEPHSWEKGPAGAWKIGGAPVVFFWGSAACPFCSASSWAILAALVPFGPISGVSFDRSSPSDVFPNTPEVVLAHLSITSRYVALDVRESTNNQTIQAPALGSCTEQAYVSAYDPLGSIPFTAVNGQYVATGTLVDPSALSGLSPMQAYSEVTNQTGSVWSSVSPQAYLMMAFLVKSNGGQPANVSAIPQVAADLGQIS